MGFLLASSPATILVRSVHVLSIISVWVILDPAHGALSLSLSVSLSLAELASDAESSIISLLFANYLFAAFRRVFFVFLSGLLFLCAFLTYWSYFLVCPLSFWARVSFFWC